MRFSSSLPFTNHAGIRRVYHGFAALSLTAKLHLMRTAHPDKIAELALASSVITPAQVASELRQFAHTIADQKPKAVLEIGTLRGGTLMLFCKLAAPGATVISIDLPAGPFGGGYKWFRVPLYKSFAASGQRLHLLRADSHSRETLERVEGILGDQKLEFLFIDGDHSYEGVRSDFNLYSPLVKAGGIVAFHDIAEHPATTGCEVSRFWNEIKGSYRHGELIADPGQGWAGIGLLYV